MKSNKLLCRILAKREILLRVAQDFYILSNVLKKDIEIFFEIYYNKHN